MNQGSVVLTDAETKNDFVKANIQKPIPFWFPLKFGESNRKGTWVQILRFGFWKHPVYGPVEISDRTFSDLIYNFDNNIRKIDIVVDVDHQKQDGSAVGWIKKLEVRPETGLWAFVEWTPPGWKFVHDKVYRYISAEFMPKYEDNETGDKFNNVLMAVTLTNRPFIKGMAPILLGEPGMKELLLSELLLEPINQGEEADNQEYEDVQKGKVLKLKTKKGGKEIMNNNIEMTDIGECDSGLEFSEEDFVNELAEPEFEYESEEESQQYDEVDDNTEYLEDYSDVDDEVQPEYEFSETPQRFEDVEARNTILQLNEKVSMLEDRNKKIADTLRLAEVEDYVGELIEDRTHKGSIHPSKAPLAVKILMEAPGHMQKDIRAFMESLPKAYEYGEIGFDTQENTDSSEMTELVRKKAHKLYDEAKRNGEPIKMGECMSIALREFENSGSIRM